MEMIITTLMDWIVNVLNFQPLVFMGFGIRVFHIVMFWVITKLTSGNTSKRFS